MKAFSFSKKKSYHLKENLLYFCGLIELQLQLKIISKSTYYLFSSFCLNSQKKIYKTRDKKLQQ